MMPSYNLYSSNRWIKFNPQSQFEPLCTLYLEMTHGLDFKTPKFLIHVIYSRFCLDEEIPYM